MTQSYAQEEIDKLIAAFFSAFDNRTGSEPRLTVVLGDINEWFFLARILRHLGAHFGQSSKARTWPSWQPLFALDRIWVHPPEALAAVRVHTSPTARGASDHLPLVGMIKVVRPDAHL